MLISFDAEKRDRVLAERGLDLADAASLFAGFHLTRFDANHSDAENSYISVGLIGDDVVIVVWTQREDVRRIITMWKANDKERQAYHRRREAR
jgi:uncharacterized protein